MEEHPSEQPSESPLVSSVISRYHEPAVAWRWLLCLLAATAVCISTLLLFKSLSGSDLPGCGTGGAFDCNSVLASRWSHIFTLPVSVLAMVLYLGVLLALQWTRSSKVKSRRRAWMVLMVLAVAMLGAAAWFIGLQVYLSQYCLYCMIAHSLGAILAVLLLVLAPRGPKRINSEDPDEPADPMMIPSLGMTGLVILGLLLVGLMITGQALTHPPTHSVITLTGGKADFDTGPGPNRSMSILSGKVHLKPADYPMIGSPDATHIIVYLFDYTCPNCRAMHKQFVKAVDDLHGQLGVVMLPVPLDSKCNRYIQTTNPMHKDACELAKLSMAVFLADRTKFKAFDQWVSQGDAPPTAEAARQKAIQMVGQDALDNAFATGNLDGRIQANITVYGMTGGDVVPQFVMGDVRVFSRPDPDQLMDLLAKHWHIKP